jgi:hypothetical protein
MIVQVKPNIDPKLKVMFDRLLQTDDKTLPLHLKFLKNMTPEMRDLFMSYFSYTTKHDLKEYDLIKRKFKNNERMVVDGILDIVTDYKDNEIWKNDHRMLVRGIYLGSMYQIKYRLYKHDPFPLALFLNSYDDKHQNFQAINLHYFVPQFRNYFVQQVLKLNKPRIVQNKEPILTLPLAEKLIPDLGLAFRNYRAEGIKVIEKISPQRWITYLQTDDRKVVF